MIYLLYTFLSGIFSGLISVGFRTLELKNSTVLFGRQIILQIIVFIGFIFLFQEYFSFYQVDTGYIVLNWFWIFFIVSSLGYYMVQVVYEWRTPNTLFLSEEEIEKLMNEKMSKKK